MKRWYEWVLFIGNTDEPYACGHVWCDSPTNGLLMAEVNHAKQGCSYADSLRLEIIPTEVQYA